MASKTANGSGGNPAKNAISGTAPGGGQLDDRILANFPHCGERIIHRSANCIIVAGPNKGKEVDHKTKKGAVKEVTNVLPVIVSLKSRLEHTSEMKPETQGMIQAAQRSQNPLFNGAKPERAMRILKHDLAAQDGDADQEEGDVKDDKTGGVGKRSKKADASKSGQPVFRKRGQQKIDFANDHVRIVEDSDPSTVMVRCKMIEEQFLANPLLHEQAAANRKQKETMKGEDSEEGDEGKGDFENFNNQRLLTPRMRKLMQNKDAREVLQEEINESVLRLKQAKFGHSLQDIVPYHQNAFYLPDKSKYIGAEQKRGSNGSVLSTGSQPSLNNRKSQLGQRGANAARNPVMRSTANMSRASANGPPTQRRTQADQARAYSSANDTASMFLTEPPSAFHNVQATPLQAPGGIGGYGLTPIQIQQSSVRKAMVNQNMSSAMRATGFSTQGDTMGHPSHLSGLNNSTLSQYHSHAQAMAQAGQSSALKSIIGGYQIGPGAGGSGSSFGQGSVMRRSAFGAASVFPEGRPGARGPNEDFYRRMGSTLTSVGTQMVNRAMGTQRAANQTGYTGRNSYRSAGPTPIPADKFDPNSTFNRSQAGGSVAAVHHPHAIGAPIGKVLNFREAWKKAIEKYSPQRPMRLNDVSYRFQEKIDEATAVQAKREGRDLKKEEGMLRKPFALPVPPNLDDDEKIKFISLIDQKPIKPSYLDLIPFKNFAKKEGDAQRNKQPAKQQDATEPRSQIYKPMRKLETVKQSVEEAMATRLKKEEVLKENKDKDLQRQTKAALKAAEEAALANGAPLTAAQREEIRKAAHEEMFFIEVADPDASANPNEPTRLKKVEAPCLKLRNQLQALQLRKLSNEQESLLRKLQYFDDTMWKYDSETLGHQLYELFFDWSSAHAEKSKKAILSQLHAAATAGGDLKEAGAGADKEDGGGSQQPDPEAEKTEKKKMAMFKMSQEMQEFLDNGGFPKVLNDIFNPTDQASMELDSVFQLKQLCKAFYEKKQNLSKQLVQCLDALANERPWAVKMKKKHFDTQSNNLLTDMEYMRINAERERIRKYQNITKESAYKYYKILKQLSTYKDKKQKEDALASSAAENQDPQYKIKAAIKDGKINALLAYITDFMKQVIEHGTDFSHSHFFMLLINLTPEEVSEPMIVQAIKIIKDELGVTELEYVEFNQGLKDAAQQKAYFEMLPMLYGGEKDEKK